MDRKILIPYYRGGAGHLSNARAIEHSIRERFPAWNVKLIDPSEILSASPLHRLYAEDWKRILSMPYPVQRALFRLNSAFPSFAEKTNRRMVSTYADACAEYCAAEKPDLILSTHWGATQLFCEGRDRLPDRIPLWSLYYEFGGVLRLYYSDADRVFYITPKVGKELRGIGHAPERLTEIDLLAQPEMRRALPGKREARESLGIDPERFTVLVSLGGEGIGKLHAYAEHYARHGAKAQLLVLAGRNTRLLEELKSFISRNPSAADKIKPYGFLPDIRTHLGAADMAAGKCGASFVSELVCARRPLAILQLGAPNEAANQDFLLERRYAWRTPDPRSFTELVDRLASDDGEYSAAVARMERASLCEGADQIADATSEYFASRLVRSSLYPADTASL